MGCIPAQSCRVALTELTLLFPSRDRSSDGICASAAHHAQNPNSDHDFGAAYDATALLRSHWTPQSLTPCGDDLIAHLVSVKDWRIKYLIWNHTMWRAYDKGSLAAWQPDHSYSGPAHEEHIHVSLWTPHSAHPELYSAACNSQESWWDNFTSNQGDDFLMGLPQQKQDKIYDIINDELWAGDLPNKEGFIERQDRKADQMIQILQDLDARLKKIEGSQP